MTATDGTNTATTTFTDGIVPVTGTVTPIMVGSLRGSNSRNTGPVAPRVEPSMAATSVLSSDGIAPGAPTIASAPAPTANFEGLHTTVDCVVPPDSDGTVGPTYYVAFVNNFNNCATQTPSGNIGFYCKAASGGACTAQGTLAAAFYYPNLFTGLSTNCNSATTHSDPQIVYDSAKDRYLIVDITTSSPYQMCVAATLSNDPIGGSYCVASYPIPVSGLPDYEKAGVWIDGFYVSYNPTGDSRTVVLNKDDLESCTTIRTQDFDMGSDAKESDNQCTRQPNHIFRPDPATYSIVTGIPAAGEPEFILSSFCLSSSIYVFTLHVDWSNSANSVLTRARILTQTQNFAPSTVASPANPMDTLRLHTMVPAPYFKDSSGNEYVWTTITTRGSSTSLSAIAWYQFKVVNNAPASTTVANQNIWNPDSTSRLQAAAAFDRQGDVLMDYSQVSSSADPVVAYAGRLAGDTVNTLGQTETILFRGSSMGSGACSTQNPCQRWGDYSSNFIDLDGCTFWFTHEYYKLSDPWQWDTRIGAAAYSSCTPLTYGRSASPTSLSYTSSGIGVTSAAQTVTMTSTGTGPLVVQPPTITGANPADFTVSSENCSTATAGISTSCTVQVTCTPSALGTRTATLNIMTNVAAADSTGVSLSCTILAPLVAGGITPSSPTIDNGQSITLMANPSGGATPYSYQWYQDGTCNTAISGATGSTFLASPSSTTTYSYKVTDSESPPVSQCSAGDTVTVNPVLVAGAITPSGPKIDNGQSVTLAANPSGGTTPYSYQWLSGSSSTCSSDTTLLGTAATQTVSPSSNTYYCYKLTDSSTGTPAAGATSTTDLVTVNPALVAGAITPSSPTIDNGQTIKLAANPSGGTTPYSFQWFTGASCNIIISGATSSAYAASPGSTTTYSYRVTDSSQGTPAGSACSAGDTVNVNPALTAPVISVSPPTIASGQSATLSTTTSFSGGTPTYTCQWLQKAPGAGSYSNLGSSFACSAGDKPTVSTGTLTTVGTWSFELQVADSSGTPFTVTSNAATLTVNKASPTMTTSGSPSMITLSSSSTPSASDTATLSGGYSPGGSITFTLYSGACPGVLVFTSSPVFVSGDGTYTSTPGFTPTAAGAYHWIASYSGDSNNNGFATSCGDTGETLTVNKATPSITSAVTPPTITLGASATDFATVSSGFGPTGSVTYTAYNDSACTVLVFTSTNIALGTPSGAFTPTSTGTFQWIAVYNGDPNNNMVATTCGAEPLTVNSASSVGGVVVPIDKLGLLAPYLGLASVIMGIFAAIVYARRGRSREDQR